MTEEKKESEDKVPKEGPLPELPPEVLDKLPPEERVRVVREMSTLMMGMARFPVRSPIYEKINEEHINRIIENQDKNNDRIAKDRRSLRRYIFWGAIVTLLAFVALLVFFQVQQAGEMVINLIIAFFSFVGGVGGGFALSKFV